MTDPDHDRLRALLEDAVADVQPAPALDRIRSRTKVTPMRRTRPWLLVAAGAVAATAATITVVSLADPRSPQADTGPGPAATTTATPSKGPSADGSVEPSPTPAPSDGSSPSEGGTVTAPPSESAAAGSGDTVAVPVYFVGDTPTGPRLFREFVRTDAGADQGSRLSTALDSAISGTATDPDYRSGWPDGVAVTAADPPVGEDEAAAVLVTLVADGSLAERPADLTEDDARIAVQQVVYTAQAVVQQRLPVAFRGADDEPLDRLLGVDVSGSAREAPAAEVQAPVWVTSPQDGDQVRRTFTVEGRGAFFEANVSWQLLRADGTVVQDGFATAEECCTLAPYAFEVTAPPGDYVLRVYAADMSDGEGPGEHEDTKRITVR